MQNILGLFLLFLLCFISLHLWLIINELRDIKKVLEDKKKE